jgi:hypothetical protein
MPRYPCPLLPRAMSQKQGTKSRGCRLSRHVSAIDDLHVTTGHEQPPRPRHVFVRLCLVAEQTSLAHMSPPRPLARLVGNYAFAVFIRKGTMKLGC